MAKKGKQNLLSEEDIEEIRELAGEGNSVDDIANLMGVSAEVLRKNEEYSKAIELGVCDMKANLRHWQMESAKSGNSTMLVWLGKIILGQREETEATIKLQREDDELTRSLESLAREMDIGHGKRETA